MLYQLLMFLGDDRSTSVLATYALVTLNRLSRRVVTQTGSKPAEQQQQLSLRTGTLVASPMISRLLTENSDYLLDMVSMRLRNLPVWPQTPRVLLAVFAHCGQTLEFPVLQDTVQGVLQAVDRMYLRSNAEPLLAVLLSAVRALRRRPPTRPPPMPLQPPAPPEIKSPPGDASMDGNDSSSDEDATAEAVAAGKTPEQIRDYFLKRQQRKEARRKSAGDDVRDVPEEKDPAKVPSMEELSLMECMEKMQHFVGAKSVGYITSCLLSHICLTYSTGKRSLACSLCHWRRSGGHSL
jgi:hypothetical protein